MKTRAAVAFAAKHLLEVAEPEREPESGRGAGGDHGDGDLPQRRLHARMLAAQIVPQRQGQLCTAIRTTQGKIAVAKIGEDAPFRTSCYIGCDDRGRRSGGYGQVQAGDNVAGSTSCHAGHGIRAVVVY